MRHCIDTNRHVNNAWYVAAAWEALPEGLKVCEIRVLPNSIIETLTFCLSIGICIPAAAFLPILSWQFHDNSHFCHYLPGCGHPPYSVRNHTTA